MGCTRRDTHTLIYKYVHTHTLAHTHAHTHTHICTYTYTYTHTHTHTHNPGDGIPDRIECRCWETNAAPDDADSDGQPNYLDLDSDGDSLLDKIEGTADDDSGAYV